MLGEATTKLGIRTIVVGPQQWGDENYESYSKKKPPFIFRALQIAGSPSFYNFTFKKFNRIISGFRPCVVYCMEEPFTIFARECLRYATEYNCPFSIFTWENKPYFRLKDPYDRMEQDVIREADKIICGNELAKKRMLNCGADEDKLFVLLQTGIDTDLFKPNDSIKKEYDVLYHGRLIREKGLPFLEKICKESDLSLLTVGGRGEYHVRYGDAKDWVKYEDLPDVINSAKLGVQIPFSFRGYQEQGNYAIAENMSCCNPVIISNNGSLPDNYGTSPLPMIDEGNEDQLKEKFTEFTENEDKYVKIGIESRKWIIEHLSLEIIAKKLLDILELA